MNQITLPRRKPRNPLVGAARFRQAGAHGRHPGGRRQRLARELRGELARLNPSP